MTVAPKVKKATALHLRHDLLTESLKIAIDAISADSYNPRVYRGQRSDGAWLRFGLSPGSEKTVMSAGTHETAGNAGKNQKRRMVWVFSGAAAAVLAAGLLMQYFRAPAGQAASETPAGTARVGGPKTPEKLAKVGKESISYDAVAEECVARHGKEVLDDLIHRLVIQQACEVQQITVTEQEVSQEIEKIAKRFNLDVGQWMQMLQAERNITPTQYRTSVIWPMVALRKLAGVQIELNEEDVKKAFIREYGPRVKARPKATIAA